MNSMTQTINPTNSYLTIFRFKKVSIPTLTNTIKKCNPQTKTLKLFTFRIIKFLLSHLEILFMSDMSLRKEISTGVSVLRFLMNSKLIK
jgi:hypothetical protein